MGLLDFLALKAKTPKHTASDEEYVLPKLAVGEFAMTAELIRRRQNEELMAKYGVKPDKEGRFV